MTLFVGLFSSCASFAKRLDSNKDLVADTGELTRYELEKSAVAFSEKIAEYFKENPKEGGVFLAFLPTKNETSESLPTKVFDNVVLQKLRGEGIFTISVKNRQSALKEFEFAQTGLSDADLSIGKLKSPNFFIRSRIDENIFRYRGDKIVEQVINLELSEIETLVVHWSDKITYRKKAVASSQVTW